LDQNDATKPKENNINKHPQVATIQDTAKDQLVQLQSNPEGSSLDQAVLNDLKKRKLASIT